MLQLVSARPYLSHKECIITKKSLKWSLFQKKILSLPC